jgi:hypothetical protein
MKKLLVKRQSFPNQYFKMNTEKTVYRVIAVILFCIYILTSCETKRKINTAEIFNYAWSDNNMSVIDNGHYHTPSIFDTLNNVLTGDTLLPIRIISDNKLVVTKHIASKIDVVQTDTSMMVMIKKTEFIDDTVGFQLIHLNNQSFLILQSNRTGLQILKSQNDIYLPLMVTQKLQPDIEIEGLKVGQSIDPTLVEIISTEQFGPIITRTATLKSNDYIYLQLKNGYFIDQIEHVKLSEKEALTAIDDLTGKFEADPEISKFTDEESFPPVEYTSYIWNRNDLVVTLLKGRTIPWIESDEIVETWSLKYNNYIISNILEILTNGKKDPS